MLFSNKVKESPSCLRSEPGPGSVWCAGMYTALGHCALTHTNSHYSGNSHCSKGAFLNVELSVGFMVNLLCPLLLNQQEYSRGMSTKKLPVVISRRSSSLFIQCVNAAIRVCSREKLLWDRHQPFSSTTIYSLQCLITLHLLGEGTFLVQHHLQIGIFVLWIQQKLFTLVNI